MTDYSRAKIYKITNTFDNYIYVGSTTDTLRSRFWKHTHEQRHSRSGSKLHTKMRELGNACFQIELIEEYPCETKQQLREREGEWIKNIGTLNETISGRTAQAYYEENKETFLERSKQWREQNTEKKKEYDKNYRENQKEKAKEYNKQYRNKNEDKLKAIKKDWGQQIYLCEICKCQILKYCKYKHERSKTHNDNLTKIQTE